MKKNAIFGLGAAIMLALFGCANSPIQSETEPLDPISSSAQTEEEAPMEKTVVATTTVKTAPYVCPTATMAYPASPTSSNMTDGENAASVGLNESIFSVTARKERSSDFPALNKAGEIRVFSDKAKGEGGYFDVSVVAGYSIKNIAINFKSSSGIYATIYKSGSSGLEEVAEVNGLFDIDAPMFRVRNTYCNPAGSTQTVFIGSIEITYEGAAKEVAAGLPTQLSLSYTYLKEESGVIHSLDRATTGITGNSYLPWDADCDADISYSGNSAGGNSSIQIRNTNPSGVVVTKNPNNFEARSITLHWNSSTVDGRKVDIYAKNEAYTSSGDLYEDAAKGVLIKTVSFNKTEEVMEETILIPSAYKYVGIKARDGTAWLTSIDIEWDTYTYSDVAIRFGNLMKKTLWDRLNTESNIQGYGVMLSNLGAGSIEGAYEGALSKNSDDIDKAITDICEKGNIKDFYTSLASKPNPDLATEEQKGDLIGDYYIWNLYKGVSNANLLKSYDAVAYIRIEDEIVFLNEVTTSVKGLAGELLALPAFNETSFDGSLNNLANLEEE